MARQEIHCPYCKQLNVRQTGWLGVITAPRTSSCCTVCKTNLRTGERGIFAPFFAFLMFVSIYCIYILLVTTLIQLFWLLIIIIFNLNPFNNMGRFLSLLMIAIGIGGGILLAETRRRKGELLARHQYRRR